MAALSLISLDLCGGLEGAVWCLLSRLYTFSFPVFCPSFSSPLCKAQGTGARWGLQILAPAEELCLSRWRQALTLDRLPAASSEWNAKPFWATA